MEHVKVALHRTNKRLRLHGTIAHNLGLAIVAGKYKTGETLTGEIASSEQLSVSRTAYREAIRILAAKGLVSSKPKIGTKVNPKGEWHILDPDVMQWSFEAGPDTKNLNSLYELREVVEPAAAAFAAIRRTDKQMGIMGNAIERMEHYTLGTEIGQQADVDFHATLLQAADNPYFISLIDGISSAILTTTVYKQREHPLKRNPVPDHVHVFEAIAEKDPEKALAAMRELIRLAQIDTQNLLPKHKPHAAAGDAPHCEP